MGAILYINSQLQVKQINFVYLKMQNDWNTLTSEHEVNILHKYGRKCRNYTIIYIVGVFGHLMLYHLVHGVPQLINFYKNIDKPMQLVFLLECGIDLQKYYLWITIYSYVVGYVCSFGIVNGGTILLMFLEHACGIFDIIGHLLTTAINENSVFSNKVNFRKQLHRKIKLCVEMHRSVILFINDVQTCFSTSYLFVFGLSVIMLSITGVQSVMCLPDNPKDAIRFGCFTIAQILHIYFLTLPTQHLLDNSLILSTCIYDTDWYHLSTETKKLLLLIMRKGSEPTTFVVGKIFILSLQFFTKILQTSMSYFTVLMSMRG
ncbi:odorant receptor 22c-like isoform X1 [Leptopilina boulardi]|uniref:odorant receptor 22c-like isoform X1 n=1 Tax=Leptopilina boulardi TaxID=63433 RepID=UPI0021F590E4|nr:odorant receptor 22c-like isoform X1 [Leptopilina boulardi]